MIDEKALQWLKNNELSYDIWERKYRYNNETFDEWLNRVSGNNAKIKEQIQQRKFLFGGRILANRGISVKGKTYSNCYVIPPIQDNIEAIYDTCGKLARTFSYGGGCGVDISNLRPFGATVNNAAKSTTGAVSFMQTISMVAETIGQQGRRGATMISIDIEHPDVEAFIDCKTELNKVTGANISVKTNDGFMHAVETDSDYILHWPTSITDYVYDEEVPYNKLMRTISTNNETVYYKRVKAKEIFNKLVKNNWDYAEPGILYWDTIKSWNILSNDPEFEYAGVNPCAEEPLPAGGSCLLGSINLAEFIVNPFTDEATFNITDFENTIREAVNALNEVLNEGLPLHPLDIQKECVKNWRQIGLGIMGIADMLIKMKLKYDSEEAIILCEHIARTMSSIAIDESANLAKAHGAYPKFNLNAVLQSEYIKTHATSKTIEKIKKYGLYNSQLLTIAPTGTLSTMLQISGGIEPIFAISYQRTTKSLHNTDKTYTVYTKIVQDWKELNPEKPLPSYFVEAGSIDYIKRIKMQSVWQNAIDASISSTINLPESTTVEDVYNIYMQAWKHNLKGVTIFRAGCKRTAILTTNKKEDKTTEKQTPKFDYINPLTRADLGKKLEGVSYKCKNACGGLYVNINNTENKDIVEIFCNPTKNGGCHANLNSLSRQISDALRSGIKVNSIIDSLSKVQCQACIRAKAKGETLDGISCGDIMARCLQDRYNELKGIKQNIVQEETTPKCPDCGEKLRFEAGCQTCPSCGWSKCN